MTSGFPPGSAEFLQAYAHDAQLRWSTEDRLAQQQFAAEHLPGEGWDDWSVESMTLELVQASLFDTPFAVAPPTAAIWLAGPIVELVEPDSLVQMACQRLEPGGKLAGIIPCLRDNSPESLIFGDEMARHFRPYPTVEELLEILREAGFEPGPASHFSRILSFNDAVLKDQLHFKAFRRIFDELENQGYDPIEVGWGELRFVATVK